MNNLGNTSQTHLRLGQNAHHQRSDLISSHISALYAILYTEEPTNSVIQQKFLFSIQHHLLNDIGDSLEWELYSEVWCEALPKAEVNKIPVPRRALCRTFQVIPGLGAQRLIGPKMVRFACKNLWVYCARQFYCVANPWSEEGRRSITWNREISRSCRGNILKAPHRNPLVKTTRRDNNPRQKNNCVQFSLCSFLTEWRSSSKSD